MNHDNVYSAAVVGGGMGGRLSLQALQRSARFDLVAVADWRADARAALERDFPGVAVFPDHESLLATRPVDVLCVSTYAPTHEEIALAALASGVTGLLVEKPLGHTAASGRRTVEAIRAKGLPMVVPHGMVAKATPLAVIDEVRQGAIGALALVEIQCRGWDILNAGIHWLHFCRMLAPDDPVRSVHAAIDATTRTFRDGLQVETAATTSVVMDSGVRIVMHTGDETPINVAGKSFVFRLVGERGVLEFYGWEHGYRRNGVWVEPPEFAVTGHQRHLENLAAQMDGAPRDDAVAEASLSALEICEAAYLSGRHGVLIPFPLASWTPPWTPGEPYAGSGGGRDGRQFA